MSLLPTAKIKHAPVKPHVGNAASTVIEPQDFDRAIKEISQWQDYEPTPLYSLSALAAEIGVEDVLYKHEGPRFGLASFKALGGAYAALRVLQRLVSESLAEDVTRRGSAEVTLSEIRDGSYVAECSRHTLVSATDGNHGRSLAWGCQRFGSACRIYIHAEVSEGRADIMRGFGAEVIRVDGDYDESVRQTKAEADDNGWHVVSDTSWPGYTQPPLDVMAGYGVMVKEITEQLDRAPTHVFLQGGVGGLAAGVAAALRQSWQEKAPRVIVVEPELAACLYESAKADESTTVVIEQETLMAGLSCGEPSPLAWQILREEAHDYLTIPESLVAPTVRLLANPEGNDPVIEAGESAIAGLAALISICTDCADSDIAKRLELDADSRVLLIGSEGITDPEIFEAIMQGRL